MPVQTQQVNLASMFGGRLAAANEMHKDKPVDKGFQRLPGGMKNAVAKLQVMVVDSYKDDKMGAGMKGKPFFRAAAVVVFSGNANDPAYHNGVKVINMQTSQFVTLSDQPATQYRKAVTLEENWADFINIFKLFGIVCSETPATDPNGQKTWAFYEAAMKILTDAKKPRYISFSTTDYKKRRPNESDQDFAARTPTLIENWHGEVEWKGITDPAQTVNVVSNVTSNGVSHQPHPLDNPPQEGPDGLPLNPNTMTPENRVAYLLKVINGPDSPETEQACNELKDMAIALGWTEEELASDEVTWEAVGNMALTPPATEEEGEVTDSGIPTVGSKWNFTKRDKNGAKLTDGDGKELPSQEVEVVTVDEKSSTVTVKAVKGGRHIVDVRTRKPQNIPFAWLE